MDIEKLYQDVWAQTFARHFESKTTERSAELADHAAAEAVRAWDPAAAHAVISAKAKAKES